MKLCLVGIMAVLPLTVTAQSIRQVVKPGPITKTQTNWQVPRTPNGKPDFQGIWTNNVATPLERPRELEGRHGQRHAASERDEVRSVHSSRAPSHFKARCAEGAVSPYQRPPPNDNDTAP